MGSSSRSRDSSGRCVPSDARMSLRPASMYSTKYAPLFSHIVRKAPRSLSKTQPSLVPYFRTSRRFRKFPHSYKHTKTFGSCLLLFPSPSLSRGKGPSPLSLCVYDLTNQSEHLLQKKVTPCDSNARIIPSEPEDLPFTGRSRSTRTR